MTIFELHERVKFWIDTVGTVRFEYFDIDNALNVAIDNKWQESYGSNRIMNHADSFQKIQRIRDELGAFVQRITLTSGLSLNTSSGIKTIVKSVTDYGYLLSLKVTSENGEFAGIPISLKRKNILHQNPFRSITSTLSRKCYYSELDGNIELIDNVGTISDVEMYYLATPNIVSYGAERTVGFVFDSTREVIAITNVSYGTSYKYSGDKFTITSGTSIGSGKVIDGYVECNLRNTLHEEISRRAAINCLLTAGYFDKAKALQQEIMAS